MEMHSDSHLPMQHFEIVDDVGYKITPAGQQPLIQILQCTMLGALIAAVAAFIHPCNAFLTSRQQVDTIAGPRAIDTVDAQVPLVHVLLYLLALLVISAVSYLVMVKLWKRVFAFRSRAMTFPMAQSHSEISVTSDNDESSSASGHYSDCGPPVCHVQGDAHLDLSVQHHVWGDLPGLPRIPSVSSDEGGMEAEISVTNDNQKVEETPETATSEKTSSENAAEVAAAKAAATKVVAQKSADEKVVAENLAHIVKATEERALRHSQTWSAEDHVVTPKDPFGRHLTKNSLDEDLTDAVKEAEVDKMAMETQRLQNLIAPKLSAVEISRLQMVLERGSVQFDKDLHSIHLKHGIDFVLVKRGFDCTAPKFKRVEEAMVTLQDVAELLNIYPRASVRIEGNTATPTKNVDNWAHELATHRAKLVKEQLQTIGIEPMRLTAVGLPGYLGSGKADIVFKITSYGDSVERAT